MQLLIVAPRVVLDCLIVSAVLWQHDNKQQDPTSIFTISANVKNEVNSESKIMHQPTQTGHCGKCSY